MAKRDRTRRARGRFKTAADAKRQFEEIEEEQRKARRGLSKKIIQSIEKSKQRDKNMLNAIRSADDAHEQYDES